MNVKSNNRENFTIVFSLIPKAIGNEIEALCRAKGISRVHINEIRLRAYGRSSVVLRGENVILTESVSRDEINSILKRVCDMAVFAHRDDISNGFVSLECGCRVGVCGYAKYDAGKLVGVSSVSSLVFRIPNGRCDFADKLYGYWRERNFCSMLICSAAGVGKTSAIRAMAAMAGGGSGAKRVVVVDERCEFNPYAYSDCTVDILRGYKRARGIEIAIRTMSAEILVVDEIGNDDDVEALMLSVGAGVPVLATTHADNAEQVVFKPKLRRLFDNSLFKVCAAIRIQNGKRELTFHEV